ncbi:sugar phosphate isomerase/epimerase [Emticicia sp. 21SJ11W-3]|uniref:sugar phosphate isomerase/epimerase family protein n=1 Tax=Emticicia sp. 21SJ11W-3 TaxID=2916755 RepID=UPI0020A13D72|nr:TIM barrel protein [Emticicia sp. 21SJ11W-3]UTA66362.1 sugar phosphate isomerase/epimerase [Emticicia sp. 21SJ11W-3]
MDRRHFIGTAITGSIFAKSNIVFAQPTPEPKINVFSKTLHWIPDYNKLAETVAAIGFDGIDLTVRPDGHVIPERVEEDLPKAVEACKKAGIGMPMIVTNILEATPLTEHVLRTASALGIKHFRMGWYQFDMKKDILAQVATFEEKMRGVAQMSKKYNISAEYQNHAGLFLGAAVWDFEPILKKINSPFLGCQYDVHHATHESETSWEVGFRIIRPYIKSIAIKDFRRVPNADKIVKEGCPLGQGVVNYGKYLSLLKQYNVSVPVTMHFEYKLGGAENGAKTITVEPGVVTSAMKKDLMVLKGWMKDNGL